MIFMNVLKQEVCEVWVLLLVFLFSGSHWKTRLSGNARRRRTSGESGKRTHTNTHASRLIISSSIVCVSERFHCINNYSTAICLAVLHRHILHIYSQYRFYPHFMVLDLITCHFSLSLCHTHRATQEKKGHPERKDTWYVYPSFLYQSVFTDSSLAQMQLQMWSITPSITDCVLQGPPGSQGPIGYPGPRGVKAGVFNPHWS